MTLRKPYNEPPLSGIPITEDEFLRLISGETLHKYELIDGIVYDMTGSSPTHSSLAGRIDLLFQIQLGRSGPCCTA
jgi:Uma2 family endonuclease